MSRPTSPGGWRRVPPARPSASVAPSADDGRGLDAAQRVVVAALAGDRSLVVVEGAAGAGKTTTLSATRDQLAAQGRRLVVVTPTLKAAKVAPAEIGTRPGRLHGWRSSTAGVGTRTATWTRLAPGDRPGNRSTLCRPGRSGDVAGR